MTLARRIAGIELMDQPVAEPAELALALRDLRAVNRWLGGWRVLRYCMRSLLKQLPPGHYRVLDVGTGSGDLPLRLVRWARRSGHHLRVLATDTHPQTLDLAREHTAAEPAIEVAWANALALPFNDDDFDFAICSTTLHHFDGEQAVRVLQELHRVGRRGVVVNDLRRSAVALLGARVLAATAWRRNRLTRHDGPLSVRRAYTASELRGLAREAGLTGARVRKHVPYRLSLVVERAQRR